MAKRRRRIDAASKLLFLGEVIADLVRIALPALASELDLGGIEPMPTEFVGQDRVRRFGDSAFRIPGARRGGADDEARRSVIVAAEFQEPVDADMLARVREYMDGLLADYRRRGLLGEDEHPVLLPFVIHTGNSRWTAADGSEALVGLPEEAVREVALYQRQAYIPMDVGGGAMLPAGAPDNRFLATARLVRAGTWPALLEQFEREWHRFSEPGDRAFRAGMHAWVEEVVIASRDPGARLPSLKELEGTKEAEMTGLFKEKIDRFRAEAVATGQRDLLVSMAERRFGAAAGQQAADALDSHPSAELLAETSSLILACETSEEFVDRLRG